MPARVLVMFSSMTYYWKHDRPISRQEFEGLFPDDACARHLARLRWGGGFRCPACGSAKGWELKGQASVKVFFSISDNRIRKKFYFLSLKVTFGEFFL